MKSLLRKFIVPALAGLAWAVFASAAAEAKSTKVHVIRFAWNNAYGPLSRSSQIYRPGGEFDRMLTQRSDGRLRLKIIERMVPGKEVFKAVATGVADMGDVPMPTMSGTFPIWNWGEIAGIVNSDPRIGVPEEQAVFRDPEVKRLYNKTLGRFNLRFIMATQWNGNSGIWTKHEIKSIDDFKGLKVRANGYLPTVALKALGASPVTLAGSEITAAVMSGTVDAVLAGINYGVLTLGLPRFTPFYTHIPTTPAWSEICVINNRAYDKLPADLQRILDEVGAEVSAMVAYAATAEYTFGMKMLEFTGARRMNLPEAVAAEARKRTSVVEKEWLAMDGPFKDDRPAMLQAVRAAVEKHRAFERR